MGYNAESGGIGVKGIEDLGDDGGNSEVSSLGFKQY
jgi:hypothetical protein